MIDCGVMRESLNGVPKTFTKAPLHKVAGGLGHGWMTEFIGQLDENQAQHLDRKTSATGQ